MRPFPGLVPRSCVCASSNVWNMHGQSECAGRYTHTHIQVWSQWWLYHQHTRTACTSPGCRKLSQFSLARNGHATKRHKQSERKRGRAGRGNGAMQCSNFVMLWNRRHLWSPSRCCCLHGCAPKHAYNSMLGPIHPHKSLLSAHTHTH